MPVPKRKANRKKSSQENKRQEETPGSNTDFVSPVRELLMLRIAREFEKREWTQAHAAKFLGVTQPRISDLTRGLSDKFTIDALVQWVGLLGMELCIDTKSGSSIQSLSSWLDASDDAIPFYARMIAANPQNSENYCKRASAYQRRGQYDLAIGDYTRAMELDPSLQHLRINRAQAYICSGQFGAAFLDCDQLIAQNQEPSLVSWAYITRASAQKDEDKALKDYGKAIQVAADFSRAYFYRGTFLEQHMKDYTAALDDFSKVLELEPENTQAKQHCENIRKKMEAKLMKDKFDFESMCTSSAHEVLSFAREEAQFFKQDMGPEHLLLGLLRAKGIGAKHLASMKVKTEKVRELIAKTSTTPIDQSNVMDRVIQHALEESAKLGHEFVGSEHLLLSIFREERAAAIFKELEVDTEKARVDLLRLLGE